MQCQKHVFLSLKPQTENCKVGCRISECFTQIKETNVTNNQIQFS